MQLPPADARAAFERGALDAWTIWDPYFAVAEKAAGVRILASGRGIARQNSFLLANSDYTRRNPEIIAAVNEELAKARSGRKHTARNSPGYSPRPPESISRHGSVRSSARNTAITPMSEALSRSSNASPTAFRSSA